MSGAFRKEGCANYPGDSPHRARLNSDCWKMCFVWLSFLSFEIRARILMVLDSVAHEAPVSLHVSRHLTPIDQRQLTTCILSDSASCHCDSVTCTWHNCFYCIPLRLCVLHRQVSECKIIRKNVAFRIIFALYPSLSNVSNSFAVFCLTCLFQCLIKR